MQPTFVTSFAGDLYRATGRRLVETFSAFQKEGVLLCAYEGFRFEEQPPNVLGFDISVDEWLIAWDQQFRKRSEDCRKDPALDPDRRLWRGRAWQWFRKTVALRRVLRLFPNALLVWVDCDVEFKASLSAEKILEALDGAGIGYHCGTRKWTEMGVVVYDLSQNRVRSFLQATFDIYESGRFLSLERWDDCWIFDHVRKEFPSSLCVDLTPPVKLKVIENGRLGKWLTHKKGFHGRSRIR